MLLIDVLLKSRALPTILYKSTADGLCAMDHEWEFRSEIVTRSVKSFSQLRIESTRIGNKELEKYEKIVAYAA